MKLSVFLCLSALLFAFSRASDVQAADPLSVKAIATSRPCAQGKIKIAAYVNASRHGSWISDSVGNRKYGLLLVIDPRSKDPSIVELKKYVFRPQVNQTNTFFGKFHGRIECPKQNRQPISIIVDQVSDIRVSKILDSSR